MMHPKTRLVEIERMGWSTEDIKHCLLSLVIAILISSWIVAISPSPQGVKPDQIKEVQP